MNKLNTQIFKFTLLTLLTWSFVFAQETNESNYTGKGLEIVNHAAPESFSVKVFLDKVTEGNLAPSYKIGEYARIGVTVTESAYIYLFAFHASGEIIQVLPNKHDGHGRNNFLEADQTKYFPPQDADYGYRVTEPTGVDKIFVVASKEPLGVTTLANFDYENAFATSKQSEEEFGSKVLVAVSRVEQSNWVTGLTYYHVTY